MKHFSQTVARNSFIGIAAQMAIKILSFAFSVLIVRELGADAFGQYSAVAAFGTMFLFIGDLGLSPYLVREVARLRDLPTGQQQIERLYGTVLVLRLLLSLLGVSLMLGVAILTGRPQAIVIALLLNAFGMLLYGIQGTSEALLAGYERLDLTSGAKVFYQVLFVLLGGAALWAGLGYYGLIGATFIAVVMLTTVCWQAVARLGLRPDAVEPARWRGLIKASIPFGLVALTLGLSYKFDSILLNLFRGDAETGYYNAAYNLVFSTVFLSNAINTALYPSLTRQAISNAQTLPAIYGRVLRYLLLLSLPIAVGVSLLAPQVVHLLYGREYSATVPALAIVIWVVPLMFVSEFFGYVVLVAGQEGRVARSVLISTSVNVTLNLLLVPLVGFLAAAVLTVLTELVLVGQYSWLLRNQLRLIEWGRTLLRPALAAGLMGGMALALQGLPLLMNALLSAGLYAGLLLLFGVVGPDEWRFIRRLRGAAPAAPEASSV
jgi:O-antigen/teichoic acid export membrane protein